MVTPKLRRRFVVALSKFSIDPEEPIEEVGELRDVHFYIGMALDRWSTFSKANSSLGHYFVPMPWFRNKVISKKVTKALYKAIFSKQPELTPIEAIEIDVAGQNSRLCGLLDRLVANYAKLEYISYYTKISAETRKTERGK